MTEFRVIKATVTELFVRTCFMKITHTGRFITFSVDCVLRIHRNSAHSCMYIVKIYYGEGSSTLLSEYIWMHELHA